MPSHVPDPTPSFLTGGGALGAMIRSFDWQTSPLGEPSGWPGALMALVSVLLGSKQAMFVVWGPDRIMLYNDAYADILGLKHPAALGQPFLEVWHEIRADLVPIVEQAYAGEPVQMDDITLIMHRRGYAEETHFSFSYTPVRDDAGQVAGFFCPCVETTAQVLADRRLKEEQQRLLRLFKEAPGFIAVFQGPEHRFSFTNAAHDRLFGEREAVGRPIRQVYPELQGQPFFDWLDRVYRTGQRHVAEGVAMRLEMADGAARHYLLTFIYEPIVDATGAVSGIFAQGYDLTETRRAQRALRESEQRFGALAQAVPNMVWTADAEGRLDWFNDRVYDYTGASLEQLIRAGWGAWVHPDDWPSVLPRWQRSVETGELYENHFRLRNAAGQYRWQLARAVAIRDDEGRVLHWVGTSTDVEDQRQMVEALQALTDTLEEQVEERTAERDRIWRNSRDLMLVVDLDGVLRAVNPAWQTLLGYVPEEAVGRHLSEFIWPEDAESTREAVLRAGRYNLDRFENRYRHHDGSVRWISWHTFLEGELIYVYGRDITDEKAQAEALHAAEEQLRQAQKMEAIGQLTGGIAHDFNNLLGGIIGSLELLELRLGQGRLEQLDRYLTNAVSSAQRAAALTHRLLAFARRQPLDPRPVDLNTLLAGIDELIRRSIGPRHSVVLGPAAGLWPTLCDPNQLESAILNLAINARDAMPDGGRLEITTANVHIGARDATAELEPGDYVAVSVRDTGIGMSPEVLERAIEPFFTTKAVGQGTGLGLSMVYGFARQSEGHLRIESQPGRGTRVQILLPRRQAVGARETVGEAAQPAGRASGRVLVVEDDPVIRELVLDLLADMGLDAFSAADGASGLQVLREQARVDLLIADLGLPGELDGRQLAIEARRLRPALRVLMITGYAEGAAPTEGLHGAGTEIILKPFAMVELGQRIEALLRTEALKEAGNDRPG